MKKRKINFPKDHQAHDSIIEWWYFNGLLKSTDGQEFSFMDCLFKADLLKVNIPYLSQIPLKKSLGKKFDVYFAHSVVSDLQRRKNYKEIQNISLISRDSFQREKLFVNYINPLIVQGFSNSEIAQINDRQFHLKTERLDLLLTSRKPALLEGGAGFIEVCGRQSFYYSLTDLQVEGKLYLKGKTLNVSGKAWMDHQWADESYRNDQWTWFSVQLANGIDLMCAEYSDGKSKSYLVDIIDRQGKQQHFDSMQILPSKKVWVSKTTKARYPQSFLISIPEAKIELNIQSLMPDQEMIFGAINYWEGPTAVEARVNGKKVLGRGFMELVGYPSDYNYLKLVSKSLRQNLMSGIKESRNWLMSRLGLS